MASEAWLRRCALHIGAQLPENQQDARKVLSYARELVEGFMMPRHAPEGPQDTLLSFNRPSEATSPSTSSTGIPRESPSQSHMGVKPGTD